jgi:outer membrane receptor protein involved in Fe transport
MRRLIALVQAALFTIGVQAQDATLKGKVTDARTGETLIGVNVIYMPGKGAATLVDGTYSFTLPAGDQTITFSSIGYTTKREAITLKAGEVKQLDVKLESAAAQLDMVVVTAGRFEQRLGEVTQSLSVLNPDIIQNRNVQSMEQAIEQVPGVVVVDEDPQIRAGSGFSYGAGSRVQVLVDDMPILSGDIGRPNWTFLPLENLEQIEVIKGASSVLYGSAALSGVINIRTAYPRSQPRTRVTVFTGIYDTPGKPEAKWWQENAPMISGANFFHSQQFGALDVVLGGNAFSDAGHIGPAPVPLDTLAQDPLALGRGGFDQRVRLNTGLRWRNKKVQGLNYGVNTNVMKSRNTSAFVWENSEEGIFRAKTGTVTRTLSTQAYIDPYINYYSKAGTRHSLRLRYFSQDFENDNDQSNANNQIFGEYQVQQTVDLFGETVLTGGVVSSNVNSDSQLYRGNSLGEATNFSSNLAAYLQLDKTLFKKVFLSAGVRYEQFTVNDDVASQPVFRAGATFQAAKATFLRASYGEGFRFPTIGERFINTNVGVLNIYPNAALRPETSWNLEAGVKQGFKVGKFMGYVDAVVFRQEFKDYVEFTFGQWGDPSDIQNLLGLGFMSVNTGGARVTGYEFELTGKGNIGAFEIGTLLGYTHTTPISTTPEQVFAEPTFPNSIWPESTFRNTSFNSTDDILKWRIQNTIRADVQLQYKRFMAGTSIRYNSHIQNIDRAFVDLDDSGLFPTGIRSWMESNTTGDTIIDMRVGMDLTTEIRVALIVNNLTNEVYALRPLAIEAPRNMQIQLTANL